MKPQLISSDVEQVIEIYRRIGKEVELYAWGPPPDKPFIYDGFEFQVCDPHREVIPEEFMKGVREMEAARLGVIYVIGHELPPEQERPKRDMMKKVVAVSGFIGGLLVVGAAGALLVGLVLTILGVIALVHAVVSFISTAVSAALAFLPLLLVVPLVAADPVLIVVCRGKDGEYIWLKIGEWLD